MKKMSLSIVIVFMLSLIWAQWSGDASSPNVIAGFNGDQVLPKVGIRDDGHTYIARFDTAAGAYQIYLQCFSALGEMIWDNPEGLLISSHPSMTWLTEWDLDVDSEGNAVLIWQDIRNNGVNNVVIYKISLEGEFLWGADGIALSSDLNPDYANMSPIVFCASNGNVYAAWLRTADKNEIWIQSLDAEGNKLWGADGISLSNPDLSYTWPQIIQADNDNILLKYYIDSGPFWAPTRHLYVAKYNPNGEQLWNTPINVAGGMTAWQQEIPFASDGANGAVLAWYDDRDLNNMSESYVQRVDSDGNVTMPLNGSLVSLNASTHQFYPKISVAPLSERIFVYWKETSPSQNQSGVYRQLMDFSGDRLWPDEGIQIVPVTNQSASPIAAYMSSQGSVCIYESGATEQSLELKAACFGLTGPVWDNESVELASNPSSKLHFNTDTHPDTWAVIAWEQGTPSSDIYAMRLNPDGSLGMYYPPPWGLSALYIPPYQIELGWQHPSAYWLPLGYQLYVNDALFTSIDGEENFCSIEVEHAGLYELRLRALYEGNIYSEFCDPVVVNVVSADDPVTPEAIPRLSVFPNPISKGARILIQGIKAPAPATLSVYNIKGQNVLSQNIQLSAGQNELSLDRQTLSTLPSGVYQFKIRSADAVFSRKVSVVK